LCPVILNSSKKNYGIVISRKIITFDGKIEKGINFPSCQRRYKFMRIMYGIVMYRGFHGMSQYFPDKAGLMFKHVQEVISDGFSVGKTELHHESTFGEFLVLQIEFLIITIINYEN
jgi:hypothetical protein